MKRTRRPRRPAAERAPAVRAEVTITALAAGGDGVGRVDGMVVFVPRTAPGDVAEIDLVRGARFARGTLRALRVASPERTEPRCAHYTAQHCGGCQVQHLTIESQRAAKSRIVREVLARIGRREVPAPEVRSAGEPWRYRRKLTLAIRRAGATIAAGLHPFDDPARVFPLHDCPITDERVLGVWRAVLDAGEFFPRSEELRGAVRIDEHGASFTLEGGMDWPQSERFFARVPALHSLWWIPADRTRLRMQSRGEATAPGASFAQVNAHVAAEMQAHVLALAMSHTPRTLIDAYAGTGDTAAGAADRGVKVTAIELDEDAVAWCRARLPASAHAVAARVEDALPEALPADVIVLNPPRAGVDARVCETLERATATTRAVVYVSCDPATLARDLARMPSWRIASVMCFDMFPQTAHVETVCELLPGAA